MTCATDCSFQVLPSVVENNSFNIFLCADGLAQVVSALHFRSEGR